MNALTLPLWSPYVAGVGIGILVWLSFLLVNRPLGCSTSFHKTAGMIRKITNRTAVDQNEYYQSYPPTADYHWILVFGIIIGAFVSSSLSGVFAVEWVPPLFAATFSANPMFRWIVALIGGILLGFGARWAGGCTSGHGLSGMAQLSVTSIVTVCFFFLGGIATAMITFALAGGL